MIVGAAHSVLLAGKGMASFLISVFMLAFRAGMFKPNIAPTTLDQYAHQQEYTKAPKSGEKVIMDPEATIQCIILVFDGLMNVGAFFALATYILREGCWLLAPKFYTWTLDEVRTHQPHYVRLHPGDDLWSH
ncbi:hypothetical protein MMC32_000145 [Xylographa parallela]|nr:hypothetical protein [Xylographa parallela]